MSHLFQSVHEQTYIAYVMAYAACIGPFEQNCHQSKGKEEKHEDNNLVFVKGIRTKPSRERQLIFFRLIFLQLISRHLIFARIELMDT